MSLPDKDAIGDWGIPFTNGHQVEDPTTDLDADAFNEMGCDVAMMTHTAVRGWVLFTGTTYTSGTVSVTPSDHDALWGSGTAVRPTVGETSAGVYVITYAAAQNDELGNAHTLNIRFPHAEAHGVSTLLAKVISWTANTITVNTYSAGALNALNGTKIAVWWS